MKKSSIGRIAIILGSLTLSLQLYGLKIVQQIEISASGSWFDNVFMYAVDPPIAIALIITLAIIIYGVLLSKEPN